MASHGGGGGGRHKFFKVLLPGSFETSLSLPPKFAAILGVLCPWLAAAKLRDRSRAGRSWAVDLHRDRDGGGGGGHRDRVSFTGSGWRGFVSDKAVSAGQLLVFEHRGGLNFVVDRFDASGCCFCDDDDNDGGGPSEFDDEAVGRPYYMMTTTAGTTTEACRTMADKEESGNCRRRTEAAPPCAGGGGVKKRRRRSPSPSTATTAVVSGGDDDNVEETLCRRIERPYQLRVLDLSKSFCDRLGWTSSRDVVLCCAACDVDGGGGGGRRKKEKEEKRWQVSVKVSGKSGMICGGWTEFAQDNGLAISDACVFVPLSIPAASGSASAADAAGSHCQVLRVHLLRGNGRGTPVVDHSNSKPTADFAKR